MSEIDIYNSIALKIRKLEKEKKKAKMTEEELRKSLEFVCEERVKLQEQVKELQQENERLKKQLEYLRTDEYLNQVKWERNFNETMNKELNLRIEKAVEYIKKCQLGVDSMDRPVMLANEDEGKILLDILNGRSDE